MSVTILQGNCLDTLKTLSAGSVHCVVTSPPYWGLRDYGLPPIVWQNGRVPCDDGNHRWGKPIIERKRGKVGDHSTLDGGPMAKGAGRVQEIGHGNTCQRCGAWRGQLGLEPSPKLYIEHLVQIFCEVRRVLRDDGTLWLNLGDSYASGKGTCYNPGGGANSLGQKRKEAGAHPLDRGSKSTLVASGLKPKDLCGIPWRVALALQDDGWWLRSEIIWAKRAPMPESVTDRPTRSHEQIFLLTKSARYFYDQEAIREPPADYDRKGGDAPYTANGSTTNGIGPNTFHQMSSSGRNQRDVWMLGPEPYPEAHFATFPTEIPRRAILAGTSERGACPSCGAPWVRIVEKAIKFTSGSGKAGNPPIGKNRGQPQTTSGDYDIRMGPSVSTITAGWHPTCGCPHDDPIPCTVLDPFSGSGTTGAIAVKLGRDYIGCELNPDYIELTNKRLENVQPLLVVS